MFLVAVIRPQAKNLRWFGWLSFDETRILFLMVRCAILLGKKPTAASRRVTTTFSFDPVPLITLDLALNPRVWGLPTSNFVLPERFLSIYRQQYASGIMMFVQLSGSNFDIGCHKDRKLMRVLLDVWTLRHIKELSPCQWPVALDADLLS